MHGLSRGDDETIVVRPHERAAAMCAVNAGQHCVGLSGSHAVAAVGQSDLTYERRYPIGLMRIC